MLLTERGRQITSTNFIKAFLQKKTKTVRITFQVFVLFECCLDFEAESMSGTTTTIQPSGAPTEKTFPAFTRASTGYDLYSAEEATLACGAMHDDYRLCTDSEVVEVTQNGAPGTNDGVFTAVDAQTSLCHTG